LLSDHKYFRTGKQCREHWINHLDASKKQYYYNIIQWEMVKIIRRNNFKIRFIRGKKMVKHFKKFSPKQNRTHDQKQIQIFDNKV